MTIINKDAPIGVFDSGIGGLTESKIAKIYMLHNSSPEQLKKMRNTRGTSIDTLVDNYNIN